MENKSLAEKLSNIIKDNDIQSFEDEYEYYFALGQILSALFIKIGGFDKYRKEFNYLTNPYLPQEICALGARVVRFLGKFDKKLEYREASFDKVYNLLLDKSHLYLHHRTGKSACEEAFYEGLYSDNAFL